jgi:hypothetical protein
MAQVRGPDWQWDDQDGGAGCTGTLAHDEQEGWWRVKWEVSEEEGSGKGGMAEAAQKYHAYDVLA